jgi:hypothetical protein
MGYDFSISFEPVIKLKRGWFFVYSFDSVKKILETSIDSLVDNFIREPYIHRCEHSLHCELYTMLTSHRALQGLYPIGNSPYKASLVHKEWPEPLRRKGKRGRGKVDLAILNREDLMDPVAASKKSGLLPQRVRPFKEIEVFARGFLMPAFVVELGLNYEVATHLKPDHDKLINSGYSKSIQDKAAYLVHFWQPRTRNGIPEKELKAIKDFIANGPQVEIAVAVFAKSHVWVKHLSDKGITEIPI